MTFDQLSSHFKTARPLLLLRSKNAPLILSFFDTVFRTGHITTITNTELRNKLENYLEDVAYGEADEELNNETLFDDDARRAAQYIDKWSNAGFLRKYPNDEGEDLHELTPDTIKVLNWMDDLQKREFVGTNSRFRDIFSRLQEMIEQSNEDPAIRIQELEKKKREIEEEINLIKLGKSPIVFTDTDIKERFYDLSKTARELLSDFSEVEQNFEQIRKDIQRKYSEKEVVKGSLLMYALDALDEIQNKDQGKSFKAFWEFLMDEKKQQELGELTNQLYQLLSERGIEYSNDRFLKNLKRYLHASGKKVIDANKKLSEKISRVLSEKSLLERRRAMELIGDIRQLAFVLAETGIKEEAFLEIEDEPYINLVDRWELSEEKDTTVNLLFPDGIGGNPDAETDFGLLFDQFAIDRKKLIGRIEIMLENKTQVTLKEVIDHYGMDNGLSEVLGYFSIASADDNHLILEEVKEPILVSERMLNMPMVIFVKSKMDNSLQS